MTVMRPHRPTPKMSTRRPRETSRSGRWLTLKDGPFDAWRMSTLFFSSDGWSRPVCKSHSQSESRSQQSGNEASGMDEAAAPRAPHRSASAHASSAGTSKSEAQASQQPGPRCATSRAIESTPRSYLYVATAVRLFAAGVLCIERLAPGVALGWELRCFLRRREA